MDATVFSIWGFARSKCQKIKGYKQRVGATLQVILHVKPALTVGSDHLIPWSEHSDINLPHMAASED